MYIYVGPSWSSTAAAAGWTRDARRRQCELEKKSAEISHFWLQSIGERNLPWSRIQQQSLCIQRFARERISKCGQLVVIIASWPWFNPHFWWKWSNVRNTLKYNYQELLHQHASSPYRWSLLQPASSRDGVELGPSPKARRLGTVFSRPRLGPSPIL